MKRKKLLIGFATLALMASGGVAANEIYKWVDEDGNIHYEDRPSGAASEQRLALSSKPTDNGAVQQRVEAFAERQAARDEARASAEVEAQEAADAGAEAEANRQKCESYRAQLQTIQLEAPLYKEKPDGEREYLDDTQREEALTRTQELIAKYCTS